MTDSPPDRWKNKNSSEHENTALDTNIDEHHKGSGEMAMITIQFVILALIVALLMFVDNENDDDHCIPTARMLIRYTPTETATILFRTVVIVTIMIQTTLPVVE